MSKPETRMKPEKNGFFIDTEAYRPDDQEHWRSKIHLVIFGTSTRAGKRFDLILLVLIVASVLIVMLDSVKEIRAEWGRELFIIEWVFTLLFSVEYVLRVLAVRRPFRYMFSFFGLVDLLAILPTFIAVFTPAAASLITVRILRMLRVFRILKLVSFLREARMLSSALRASRRKITVFLSTVLTLVVILGTLMYIIEDSSSGFTSIPRSIYWAIVTLTTVGYGDIAPATPIGQALAAFIMILGYSIIAIPTGIVSSELVRADRQERNPAIECPNCHASSNGEAVKFCWQCGHELTDLPPSSL